MERRDGRQKGKGLILFLMLLQVFGHSDVSILDGGLQRWKFRGFPLQYDPPSAISPQTYNASFDERLVRTFDQMIDNYNNKNEQVGWI